MGEIFQRLHGIWSKTGDTSVTWSGKSSLKWRYFRGEATATLKHFCLSIWHYRPDRSIKGSQTESSSPSVFLMCLISPYFIYLSFWQGRKGKAEHIIASAVVPGLCPPGMFDFTARPRSYRRQRHIPPQGSWNRVFKFSSSQIYCWADYLNDLWVLFYSPPLYQALNKADMCDYSFFCPRCQSILLSF